jgi:hypothetical protein
MNYIQIQPLNAPLTQTNHWIQSNTVQLFKFKTRAHFSSLHHPRPDEILRRRSSSSLCFIFVSTFQECSQSFLPSSDGKMFAQGIAVASDAKATVQLAAMALVMAVGMYSIGTRFQIIYYDIHC